LYTYQRERSSPKLTIDRVLRPLIGQALVDHLLDDHWLVLSTSVSSDHAHLLVMLPDTPRFVRAVVGEAKRVASRAVKRQLPGTVWSAGCDAERVRDSQHLWNAYRYVLTRQGADSWTWSYEDSLERLEFLLRGIRGGAGALPRRGGWGDV